MANTIASWLLEAGTDVLCTDNQWITQMISRIDEDKWFEALEIGVFAEEYQRLKEHVWLNRIAQAHSWGHIELQHG